MDALPIDFARPSHLRTLLQISPACAAGMIAGICLIAGAALAWQSLPARPALTRPPATHEPAPATPLGPAQAEAINRATLQLNLPWRELFDALEAATPPSIVLLELAPDAGHRQLSGKAEAADAGVMFDYLARLQQQPFFDRVLLTRHEIQSGPSARPLHFAFDAQWKALGQ